MRETVLRKTGTVVIVTLNVLVAFRKNDGTDVIVTVKTLEGVRTRTTEAAP